MLIPFDPFQFPHKLKDDMTYVIAGKLNNTTFLMVDCIITRYNGGINTYHFTDKLGKLASTQNTFYTAIGSAHLNKSINLYDRNLYLNNNQFNPNDDNYINEILDIYKHIVQLDPTKNKTPELQRIFFINNDNVICYNIKHTNELTFKITQNTIPNNCFLTPTVNSTPSIIPNDTSINDLQEFCKNQIILEAENHNGIDFKNKFSFVFFDQDNYKYFPCYLNNFELAQLYFNVDYNTVKIH